MAHVTFIHGIAQQAAPKDAARAVAGRAARQRRRRPRRHGGRSSMVYWADLLYAEPLPERGRRRAMRRSRSTETVAGEDADMTWLLDVRPGRGGLRRRRRARRSAWRRSLPRRREAADVVDPDSPSRRSRCRSSLKRRLMRVFLRDVHHYLYDAEFAPRAGGVVPDPEHDPGRTIEALTDGRRRARPPCGGGATAWER